MPARRLNKAERGLTLVEVMCAVVVLGIALIGIFQTIEVQIGGARAVAERAFAHWAAFNRLEEIRIEGEAARERGEESEEIGGVMWQTNVTFSDGPGGLFRAEVVAAAPDRPGALIVEFIPHDGLP